jgi:predicted Fe-Mo cluster-binding NifX family protein
MKVSIPTMGGAGLNERIGEHFGRVPTYTIVDLESNDVKIIPNTSQHMGGQGDPPELLAREGVHIMICQGLGRKAITLFESLGITVYIGANGTVKEAVDMYKQGILRKATESDGCGKHAFRDHHH